MTITQVEVNMKKLGTILLSVCLLGSLGCKPSRKTANPGDYELIVESALEAAQIAAMIGRNEAIKNDDFAGCVVSDVLGAGLDSVQDALKKNSDTSIFVPGFEVDLSECMAIQDKRPLGNDKIKSIVDNVAGLSLSMAKYYASQLLSAKCEKGVAIVGALAYLENLVPAISDEIANPDGKFKVEGLRIEVACQ
jgi:hypothetical protein